MPIANLKNRVVHYFIVTLSIKFLLNTILLQAAEQVELKGTTFMECIWGKFHRH